MKTDTAGYLVIFGIFICVLGVINYQTHPERATMVLMIGGALGALLAVWGILGAKGFRWSWAAAVFTATLLSLRCVWRASVGWLAVAEGQAERAFAALVVTLMLGVSAGIFWMLMRERKVGSTAKRGNELL